MTTSLYYYRGVEFIKDYFVKYLTYVFVAEEKGLIEFLFFDGTKKAEFSRRPQIIKKSSWDFRNLPAILIGPASGSFKILSFTKDHIDSSDETNPNQYREVGGNIELSIELDIRAGTIEERDKLVDITGIFLSHPAAKDYFYRHGIVLPTAPAINEGSSLQEPAIDYPIYNSIIRMDAIGTWRARETLPDRLSNVIADIEASFEV